MKLASFSQPKNQYGVSVVEVLIALSLGALLIVSIGTLVTSIHRLNTAGAFREKALGYARESVELLQLVPPTQFTCVCGVDDLLCSSATCTKAANPPCTLLDGYNSCWLQVPDGLTSAQAAGQLMLSNASGSWRLVPGEEDLASRGDPGFFRSIALENENDPNNPAPPASPIYFNTKKATITVRWTERGAAKSASLITRLTGWRSLP